MFLPLLPPYRPLGAPGVSAIVRRRQMNLGQELKRFGAHGIRHACATHLLSEGFTLKQIGDHLGHATFRATEAYAKVDLRSLRLVGDMHLPTPVGRRTRQERYRGLDVTDELRIVAELSLGELQ